MVHAPKRLVSLDEHRVNLVAEIVEGLERLRFEASQVPQPKPSLPAPPLEWAAELHRLRTLIGSVANRTGIAEWPVRAVYFLFSV